MQWPLKPMSGVTVAPNIGTSRAESALQAESSIHGPGKPGKMEGHVPWGGADRSRVRPALMLLGCAFLSFSPHWILTAIKCLLGPLWELSKMFLRSFQPVVFVL